MHVTASLGESSPANLGGVRVTVARTIAEVEALRSVWERLPVENIDADIDHFLTVVAHRREVLRPHVVLIERPGRSDLLAVARLEQLRLESRVGYRVVARPRVRCILVSFDGVVGAEDEEDYRRIVKELRQPLRSCEADLVLLPKLGVDGSFYRVARAAGPWLCRDPVPARTVHWMARVPTTIDDFMAARSSKTRRNARYYDKRLHKAHGNALVIRRFRREDELAALCADMEAVAAKTYQRQLGAGFTGDELERELMALGLRRRWFRAWVVYVAGAPVAFWVGMGYRGTFTTGATGFDPDYARDRVGSFVLNRMLEDLCADDAISLVDYGHGDAEYKRNFGDESREEADVLLFAPRLRAVRINLVRGGALLASGFAKRLVADTPFAQRLKKAWRGRLASRTAAHD